MGGVGWDSGFGLVIVWGLWSGGYEILTGFMGMVDAVLSDSWFEGD